MKRIIAGALLGALLLALCSCGRTSADLTFYVLAEGTYSLNQTDEELFQLAKKQGRKALTQKDLNGVLWQEQRFELKGLNVLGACGDGGSALFQATAGDLFVVALGNRVLFSGGFAPKSGTLPVKNPYIKDETHTVFALCYDEKYGTADTRWNDTLYRYLADHQLLVSNIFEPEEDE